MGDSCDEGDGYLQTPEKNNTEVYIFPFGIILMKFLYNPSLPSPSSLMRYTAVIMLSLVRFFYGVKLKQE